MGQDGGGNTSGIGSELLLICSGDGQVDWWGQPRFSVDSDVCR